MRFFLNITLSLLFTLASSAVLAEDSFFETHSSNPILVAQAGPMGVGTSTAPKQGCRAVDVHCKCINPEKNFVVKNQPLGKVNPVAGDKGECKTKPEIDSQAKKLPIAYCLRGTSGVKDERKGASQCTATWTCAEACTFK